MGFLKLILVILLFSSPLWLLVAYVLWSVKLKRRKFWNNILDVFNQKKVIITSEIPTDRNDTACIAGEFMGNKIFISDASLGNYRRRLQFTQTEVHLNRKTLPDLRILRWGEANFKTGNRDFDESFVIQTTQPEQTKTLFTPKVISEFLNRRNEFKEGGIECKGKKLVFTMPGIISSEKKKKHYLLLFDLSAMLLE